MTISKSKVAVVILGLAGLMTLLAFKHTEAKLRERNGALRQQVERLTRVSAESRPLPSLVQQTNLALSLPGDQWRELLRLRGELGLLRQEKVEVGRLRADNSRLRSNWVEQLVGGKKLTLQQVAPYLKAKQRSAESLLAASGVTGDLSLLREAVERYPNDPHVNFAACFAFKNEASPRNVASVGRL